jgi:hypothetical protein
MLSRNRIGAACAALALALAAGAAFAGRAPLPAPQIVRHPAPSGALAARLDWALAEAAKTAAAGKGFWVGYGIRREMGEHSQVGVNISFTSTEPSLEERIYGRRPAAERKLSTGAAPAAPPGKAPAAAVHGFAERKVVRELGVLLRFGAPAGRHPRSISVCTLSYGVMLEDVPLFWIGPAAEDDSVRLLTSYFAADASADLRSAVIEAVALHRWPDLVIPFLEKIVAGREPEDLRKAAVAALGDQPDARALDILKRTTRADASIEVRKAAVSGLADMALPGAFDALADLALHEREKRIRVAAIEALGEFHTLAASKTLVDIIKSAR